MSSITIKRNYAGAYVAYALCNDGTEDFLETVTFYGYSRAEIPSLFRENCRYKNIRIVK